ncbi:MAG: hypothetical protein QXJ75_02215 [Candidatus Bathyarchaeia archaeon]
MGRSDVSLESPRYPDEMLWWTPILVKIMRKEDLTLNEAKEAANRLFCLLKEERAEAQVLVASFFGGLTVKGVTVDELAGMASAVDESKLFKFQFDVNEPVITGGGTGGDTLKTINVTTPALIVASAAGALTIKSAAKAFSSKTGAADLAVTLGVKVDASPDVVKKCLKEVGTAVWASAGIYPWMEPILKFRNLPIAPVILPLISSLRLMIATSLNPFSVKRQIRGISIPDTEMVARVLSIVGQERALVTIGYGRSEKIIIDELSNLGDSVVSELKHNGEIETYKIHPEDLGVKLGDPDEVRAKDTHEENAKVVLKILAGKDRGARRDLVLINAGAVLYLAEKVKDLKDGYELACQVLDSTDVTRKVEDLVAMSGGDVRRYRSLLSTI